MHGKPDQPPRTTPTDAQARRRGVVRTALIVGGIAVLIYVGFILLGAFGR